MKQLIFILACIAFVAAKDCVPSPTTVSGTHAPKEFCSGDLIFEDNFDDFDAKIWEHETTLAGGGNWEFQWYGNNRSNSYTENGVLYIRPTLTVDTLGYQPMISELLSVHGGGPREHCTNAQFWGCERMGTPANIVNPVRSARVRTQESFNFKYGKAEIKAQIPVGDWLWPAIWFMPRWNHYGTWPNSGEIDLMESRGNLNLIHKGVHIGTQQIGQTLHFGPYYYLNGEEYVHIMTNDANGFEKDYHLYQLEWTPDYIKFSIDNVERGTVRGPYWQLGRFDERAPKTDNPWRNAGPSAPFDQEFYLILNVAVGGTNGYFPDDAQNPTGKPWSNQSPVAYTEFWNNRGAWLPTWDLENDYSKRASMKVDYVKVWAI